MHWLPTLYSIPITGCFCLYLARQKFRHTTLNAAWWWWVAAATLFSVAVAYSSSSHAGTADQLWYFSAVLALCPFVSALGARRPGSGAWVFFVTIPMLLVLEWPALSLLVMSEIDEPLVLQTPAVIGAFLVLLMGAGNYIGTRFTAAILLFCFAEVCIVVSVCELRPEAITPLQLRITACVPLLLSILMTIMAFCRWESSKTGITRVWADFRDSFGIVWSRRVAERFNLMAKRAKLGLRIQNNGPVLDEELPDNDDRSEDGAKLDQSREEQILRWILKRFVDEPWLNHRLGNSGETQHHNSTENNSPPTGDDSVNDNTAPTI